jgi:TPP-dependent pyruvate/acetoin dehydrogenase alpha subunit
LKAAGYGVPSWPVDGMDVVAVENAARRAVEAIKAGGGPYFLELRTYRFRAHSMFDPELYRDKGEVKEWMKRDPITLFTEQLRAAEAISHENLTALEREVADEVARAVAFAEASTDEPIEQLTRFVYSEANAS